MYYFGVWSKDRGGHYLYTQSGDSIARYSETVVQPGALPCAYETLDGGFVPRGRLQGAACLWHRIGWPGANKGWTILSFHDYTGDSRPGSSSTFLCKSNYSLGEMIELGRKFFPSIWKRLDEAGVEVRIAE